MEIVHVRQPRPKSQLVTTKLSDLRAALTRDLCQIRQNNRLMIKDVENTCIAVEKAMRYPWDSPDLQDFPFEESATCLQKEVHDLLQQQDLFLIRAASLIDNLRRIQLQWFPEVSLDLKERLDTENTSSTLRANVKGTELNAHPLLPDSETQQDFSNTDSDVSATVTQDVRDLIDRITNDQVLKLQPVISHEMKRIAEKIGSFFSYNFGVNMELTAYLGDPTKTAVLKKELEGFLGEYIFKRFVKVTVKEKDVIAFICASGIGSKISAMKDCMGGAEQTVGLYLLYDNDGMVYWVSNAHGLLPTNAEQRGNLLLLSNFCATMHIDNRPRVMTRIKRSKSPDSSFDCPTPYAYFCSNPTFFRRGRRWPLSHFIDISLGPTPLTLWHLNNSPFVMRRFNSALENCGTCKSNFCVDPTHPERRSLYTVSEVRYFSLVSDKGFYQFNAQKLCDKSTALFCQVRGESSLIRGKVGGVINQTRIDVYGSICIAQNMVKILPTDDIGRPQLGHSGSVWVQMKEGSSERCKAVAITCAIVKDSETEDGYWLAQLLCASLLALSEEYPSKFPNYEDFKVPNFL